MTLLCAHCSIRPAVERDDPDPYTSPVCERCARRRAEWKPGDEVRWHESPPLPVNRATVLETLPNGRVRVEFQGPEGVGVESFDVLPREIVNYRKEGR